MTSRDERRGDTSGRAPSWTSTTRSVVHRAAGAVEGRQPRGDRRLAPVAALDDRDDRRRQPGGACGPRRPAPRRVTTTIRSTSATAASASSVQASSGRPATGREQLVGAAHPGRAAGGDHDGIRHGRPAGRAAGRGGAQSSRGWAKIILPGHRLEHAGHRRRRRRGRCIGRRPRPRSSCRRRGTRRPGRPPCPPG